MDPNIELLWASIANIERLLIEARRRGELVEAAFEVNATNQAAIRMKLVDCLSRIEGAARSAHTVALEELLRG